MGRPWAFNCAVVVPTPLPMTFVEESTASVRVSLLVWMVTDFAVTVVTRPLAFRVAPDWALGAAW